MALCIWEMLVLIFRGLSKFEVQILFFFYNMQKSKYLISAFFQVISKEIILYPVVEFTTSEWSGGAHLLALPDFINFIPVDFM